jgi:hypothetical protein
MLLAALPVVAADPICGVWQMRNSGKNKELKSQVVAVEPSGGGVKFSYDLNMSGARIQYSFVTKMDGAAVPAISNGAEIMKVWVKKVSPYEYDSGSVVQGTETRFKGTISPDGKTWTTDGTIKTGGQSIPSHVIFDRVK